MAMAAGSIPSSDESVSIGVGFGVAGGQGAVALGAQIELSETTRFSATLMRTSNQTGFGAGLSIGF